MIDPATPDDIATVTSQLGRYPRGMLGVAARCRCGRPIVVATAPRLPDGTPFPTFYYLTHPAAVADVSRLESAGLMPQYAALLDDPVVAAAYRAAHESYLADRGAHGTPAEIEHVSAGGMPDRVKCLHALVAHALAAGPGVNPVGDAALADLDWRPDRCECTAQ